MALTGPQEFIGEMVAAWDRRRRNRRERAERDQRHRVPAGRGRVLRLRRHPRDRHDLDWRPPTSSCGRPTSPSLPAVAFGDAGEGHVRLSFATSDELLEVAADRIGQVLGLRSA